MPFESSIDVALTEVSLFPAATMLAVFSRSHDDALWQDDDGNCSRIGQGDGDGHLAGIDITQALVGGGAGRTDRRPLDCTSRDCPAFTVVFVP